MLARTPWTPPIKTTAKARPKQLNRDRRLHLIARTAELLTQGEPTRFEFEGACRHGLRAAFCLDGWGWIDADTAAADVVSAALKRLGAQRPTWQQGQPEWVDELTERTRCAHCAGLIPADRGSSNGIPVKFCSEFCGQAAYAKKARQSGETRSIAEHLAECAARTARTMTAEIECKHCRKLFRPGYQIRRRQFCSKECADAGKPSPRRLPFQPCVGCGKSFKPKLADRKYCSPACYQGRGNAPVKGDERTCPVCCTIFRVHAAVLPQVHCSRKCSWVTRRGRMQCEAAE